MNAKVAKPNSHFFQFQGEFRFDAIFDDSQYQRPPMLSLGEYMNRVVIFNDRASLVFFELKMYLELIRDVKRTPSNN
jgi:hypothetical protein